MELVHTLVRFAGPKLSSGNDWYRWKNIDAASLPAGIRLPDGNQYLRSVALKHELHRLWQTSETEDRLSLARYYVSTWGGVRGNNEATLRHYVTCPPESLIQERGTRGVASWSKVLCIADPSKYAIYDARVAVALNCLQVVANVERPVLYPMLASQNKTIKPANAMIRAHAERDAWRFMDQDTYYRQYLVLLEEAAGLLDESRHALEMLLFAQAGALHAAAFQAP